MADRLRAPAAVPGPDRRGTTHTASPVIGEVQAIGRTTHADLVAKVTGKARYAED